MIFGGISPVLLVQTTDYESALPGVFVCEAGVTVRVVFVIHPYF